MMGFDFRINDLDETLEVKRDSGDWQRMSDATEAAIRTKWRELEYDGRKPSIEAMRDAYIMYADQRRYNPIRDYFQSIEGLYKPGSNGPYIIPTLATYFKNPDGLFGTWLFKWMTGAIAKVYQAERNPMLVLASNQRIGKSTFVRWLCPLPNHFLDSGIKPDNKDANLHLADVFVQEVGELGATTRRADLEELKAFITKPFIFERPPYGRYPIHKRAITSFVGTVNPDGVGFLNDPTGSSRFLVCEIESIDFGYTALDVNELWSEAYWFYRNVPDCWKLTQEEMRQQAQVNEQFEMMLALEDVVELRLEISLNSDDFLTTKMIQAHLLGHHSISDDQKFYREIAKVLHKKGCRQGKIPYKPGQPHLRGWSGVRKRENETPSF
jgi:predicted P-loop ATPase